MNEQALNDAFNLFVQSGYDGDINKFVNLISTNPEALRDAHQLFVQTGYDGDINRFKNLIGIGQQQPAAPKKKDGGFLSQPLEAVQEAEQLVQQESVSPSDQSSSESQSPSFYSQLPQAGMQQGPPMRPAEQMDQSVQQQGFIWDQPKTTLTASMQPVSKYEADQKRLQEDKRLKKEAAENLLNWRETQALKIQEEEKSCYD